MNTDTLLLPEGGDRHDWVVGGDSSVHNQFCSYGVAATRQAALAELDQAIAAEIVHATGMQGTGHIEIHAKEIWNGSSRQRTPFSRLISKEQMREFFRSLSRTLHEAVPIVVVATAAQDAQGTSRGRRRLTVIKRVLINLALGRLNTNFKCLHGKNIGRPCLYLDREAEALIAPHRRGRLPGGFIVDVDPVEAVEGQKTTFRLRTRVDPIFQAIDSRAHRLVQVGDMSTYFVNKYLVDHSLLWEAVTKNGRLDLNDKQTLARIEDANFSLEVMDLLNVESVLAVSSDQFQDQPAWMQRITERYRPVFEAGVDLCCCSMREALQSPENLTPITNGIGYWALAVPPQRPSPSGTI